MANPEDELTLRDAFRLGKLRGRNLENAQLSKKHLTHADLRDANLCGADLTAADLSNAILSGANLQNANLKRARLVRTNLDGAKLTGANLDRTDFRGAQGLTEEQLTSAINGGKAILDPRMLSALNRIADLTIARHGRKPRKRSVPDHVDLKFDVEKPSFGDVYLLCGDQHPRFPSTGVFGFEELTDLGIEQVDDYFAICADGDPVVWFFPLVKGNVVEHHPGPFDGIRIELSDKTHKKLWTRCVTRFKETLKISE
jgi:hypothetical protein